MATKKAATNGKSERAVIVTRFDARLPVRFWDKVAMPDANGCWLWLGCLRGGGYGGYRVGGKGSAFRAAHRVAYEALISSVARGLQLDHLCRVRACVNPAHLEPVTPRENTLRGETPAARNAAKTVCPSGHVYDAENTYVSRGIRYCRTCVRLHQRKWKLTRRENRHGENIGSKEA